MKKQNPSSKAQIIRSAFITGSQQINVRGNRWPASTSINIASNGALLRMSPDQPSDSVALSTLNTQHSTFNTQ